MKHTIYKNRLRNQPRVTALHDPANLGSFDVVDQDTQEILSKERQDIIPCLSGSTNSNFRRASSKEFKPNQKQESKFSCESDEQDIALRDGLRSKTRRFYLVGDWLKLTPMEAR